MPTIQARRVLRRLPFAIAILTVVAILPGLATAADPPPAFRYEPQTLTKENLPAVAKLYAQTCAGCHGVSGGGVNNGLALYASGDVENNAASIHFGAVEPVANGVVMPAFGAMSILTPTEIGQLAAYVETLHPDWP